MSAAEELAKNRVELRKSRKCTAARKRPFICHIREVRQGLRLTIDEVATELKMSKAGLSEIERGSDPMLTTAFNLSEFYGKDINQLWKKSPDFPL